MSRSFATVAVLIVGVYAVAESSDSAVAVGGVVCLLAAGTIVALRGLGVAGRIGPAASASIASIGVVAALGSATGIDAIVVPAIVVALIFSLVAPAMILRHIMRAAAIDNEIIAAAISLYLLVGILFGTAFTVVAHNHPAAFNPYQEPTADESSSLYYLSFVTLTTVGFGDVVPATGMARTLVVIEALVGQIVLVALVARLVGMQTSTAPRSSPKPPGADPQWRTVAQRPIHPCEAAGWVTTGHPGRPDAGHMHSSQTPKRYRMCVSGMVGDHVARALGSMVEPGPDGSVLVGDYVDQAHLTGVINRLHDLRIQIQRVEVVEEAS